MIARSLEFGASENLRSRIDILYCTVQYVQALTQRLKNNYRQIHSTCLSQLHPSIYGPSFDLPFMVYLIKWHRRTRSKLSCNDASHDVINRTAQDCVARLVLVLTRPSLSLIVRMACNQKCTALCLSRSLRSLKSLRSISPCWSPIA